MSTYETLQDIREAVIIDSKTGSTSNSALQTQVNRFINEAYYNIITRRKREWLDKDFFYVTDPKQTGTGAVTKGSTSVSFDTSSITISSTTGYIYKLYAGASDTIYDVASISGNTITLESAFAEDSNTATTLNLVQSGLTLPTTIKTVYQADHDKYNKLVDLRGIADFKEGAQQDPQRVGYADMATTSGSTSSSQGLLYFYPYAEKSYTLKIHASIYFTELSADTDQPLIPKEYRQIFYHYAMARVYATISRNSDLFTESDGRYRQWLARLDTEVKPAMDEPRLVYDRTIRASSPYRRFRNTNRYEPES